MEIKLANLILKNPVILASGTFDKSIIKKIDISKLGAVVTKTITLKPRVGNPLPHITIQRPIDHRVGGLYSVKLVHYQIFYLGQFSLIRDTILNEFTI